MKCSISWIKLAESVVHVSVFFDFLLLSVAERRVSKALTITGNLSVSCCSFTGFCCVYFEALLLGTRIFRIIMSSC